MVKKERHREERPRDPETLKLLGSSRLDSVMLLGFMLSFIPSHQALNEISCFSRLDYEGGKRAGVIDA